jgi:hypothetical protein
LFFFFVAKEKEEEEEKKKKALAVQLVPTAASGFEDSGAPCDQRVAVGRRGRHHRWRRRRRG